MVWELCSDERLQVTRITVGFFLLRFAFECQSVLPFCTDRTAPRAAPTCRPPIPTRRVSDSSAAKHMPAGEGLSALPVKPRSYRNLTGIFWLIRPGDALAGSCRFVSSINNLQRCETVLAGFHRFLFTQHSAREVPHLVRESVKERFLKYCESPAFGLAGLLHGISVTALAIGFHGTAAQKVAMDNTLGPVKVSAVIHASLARPAIFDNRNAAVFEFNNHDRIVVALGSPFVINELAVSGNAFDLGLAIHPAGPLNTVASHIHQRSTA